MEVSPEAVPAAVVPDPTRALVAVAAAAATVVVAAVHWEARKAVEVEQPMVAAVVATVVHKMVAQALQESIMAAMAQHQLQALQEVAEQEVGLVAMAAQCPV